MAGNALQRGLPSSLRIDELEAPPVLVSDAVRHQSLALQSAPWPQEVVDATRADARHVRPLRSSNADPPSTEGRLPRDCRDGFAFTSGV